MSRRAARVERAARRPNDYARQLVWVGTFVVGTAIAGAALPRRFTVDPVVIGAAAATILDALLSVFRGWRSGPSDALTKEPWPGVLVRLVVVLLLLGGLALLLHEIS